MSDSLSFSPLKQKCMCKDSQFSLFCYSSPKEQFILICRVAGPGSSLGSGVQSDKHHRRSARKRRNSIRGAHVRFRKRYTELYSLIAYC
jgi:hypothetical protein